MKVEVDENDILENTLPPVVLKVFDRDGSGSN
jgi:hypothetical protein